MELGEVDTGDGLIDLGGNVSSREPSRVANNPLIIGHPESGVEYTGRGLQTEVDIIWHTATAASIDTHE